MKKFKEFVNSFKDNKPTNEEIEQEKKRLQEKNRNEFALLKRGDCGVYFWSEDGHQLGPYVFVRYDKEKQVIYISPTPVEKKGIQPDEILFYDVAYDLEEKEFIVPVDEAFISPFSSASKRLKS